MRRVHVLAAAGLALCLGCEDETTLRPTEVSSAVMRENNLHAVDPCADAPGEIAEGFGAPGPFAVERSEIANPQAPGHPVQLFLPAGAEAPQPVVLFAHANAVAEPKSYGALLEHLASRGLAVVFPPYMVESTKLDVRYDVLWQGLAEALRRHPDRLDAGRLGFVGHSFGAGALPALVRRAHEAGLGRHGLFLLAMAPWYPLTESREALAVLPPNLLSLVLVFDDDRVTDPRIAIALFEGLPPQRDYLRVPSVHRGECTLEARHTLPQSRGLRARDDALDRQVIFRLADALAAAAFEGSAPGRAVALGRGGAAQVSLGHWADGTPLPSLGWSETPQPAQPPEHYLFPASAAEGWQHYQGPIATGR